MAGSSHSDVMVAGAVAAFTVDLLVYPLDTLKTRQQSQDFVRTFAKAGAARSRRLSPELFRGLYQGIGIVIFATLPAAGTFFTTYEAAKTFLGRHAAPLGLPQPLVHSAASAVAEMTSCFVLTPAEVIKQNAQMVQSRGGGGGGGGGGQGAVSASASLQAIKQLSGPRWARNLMSGYTAMVARNLPFTALQFPIFEYVRETVWKRRAGTTRPDGDSGGGERSLLETGLVTGASAGLAGSFAAVVTTPMDVVKTRMMLAAGQAPEDAHASQKEGGSRATTSSPRRDGKPGGLAIARQVYREQGVPALFRGAVLRGGWTAMGSGLYLGMYEVARVWLTQKRESADERSLWVGKRYVGM